MTTMGPLIIRSALRAACASAILLALSRSPAAVSAFTPARFASAAAHRRPTRAPLAAAGDGPEGGGGDVGRTIKAAPLPDASAPLISLSADEESAVGDQGDPDSAKTGTVNERLIAELSAASDKEKYGRRSSLGKKVGAAFRSEVSDAERERRIEEARDLNGVNPLVALGGSVFAFGMALACWTATGFLAEFFSTNPVDTDIYTITRLAGVFRNAVMGLSSLASGFAGVTGLGLFLLGVRVGYGVMTGELDPTPIKKGRGEELVLPDVWNLMMNKKPDRRSRRGGKSDDNPFGL